MNRTLKTATITVLAAAAAGALAAIIIRGQISRHRRDLFSPRAFRRLAALGHMSREPASVDAVRVLRDYISWEPRRALRDRAKAIVNRMMSEVGELTVRAGPEIA